MYSTYICSDDENVFLLVVVVVMKRKVGLLVFKLIEWIAPYVLSLLAEASFNFFDGHDIYIYNVFHQ